MKISEKRLCQIIKEESRRALFEKNDERIKVKIITRANTVTPTGGAGEIQNYKIRDANPENVKSEKELKRIWAEEVIEEKSRNFFDGELIKVHFINSLFFSGKSRSDTPGFVRNHPDKFKQAVEFIVNNSSKSRDEISCLGYLPGDVLKGDVKDKIGIIVKGWTTYVSTIDAETHMTSMASDELKSKQRGLHKRPRAKGFNLNASEMAVDKESFLGRSSEYHEIIVDNWIPTGVVIHSDFFKKEAEYEVNVFSNVAKEEFKDTRERYKEKPEDIVLPSGPIGQLLVQEQRIKNINTLIERGVDVFDENFVKYKKIRIPYEFFDKSTLKSVWSGLLAPVKGASNEQTNVRRVEGDPDKSELDKYGPDLQITKKNLNDINFSNITKNLNFTFCKGVIRFKDMKSRKISMLKCSHDSNVFSAPSIENCENTDFIFQFSEINSNFKIEPLGAKSLNFSNCKFSTDISIYDTIIKNLGAFKNPITISNCDPLNVEDLVNQLRKAYAPYEQKTAARESKPSLPSAPVEDLFYFGPNTSAPVEATVANIVSYIQANPNGNHQVHVNGSWVSALIVPEIAKELSRLGPPPPPPRLPPPPPPPGSGKDAKDAMDAWKAKYGPKPLPELRMLRRLIKDYL